MKLVRILVLILCACFGSLAWGQQAPCPPQTPWAEFHRYSMQRWNPCETVLRACAPISTQFVVKLSQLK